MARSPARTVGGIPYDAALSDGHQPQHGHDGARSPATGFSHCAAAGGARRSHNLFRGRVSSKNANAHASVRSATSRAAKTQKNYFDKQVKEPPFALNQLVWLYWPHPLLRTRSRKLTMSWAGPWRIVECKTTIVVVVQNVKTTQKTDGTRGPLGPVPWPIARRGRRNSGSSSDSPASQPRRPARLQDYDLSN